jgi:hypothetical protein
MPSTEYSPGASREFKMRKCAISIKRLLIILAIVVLGVWCAAMRNRSRHYAKLAASHWFRQEAFEENMYFQKNYLQAYQTRIDLKTRAYHEEVLLRDRQDFSHHGALWRKYEAAARRPWLSLKVESREPSWGGLFSPASDDRGEGRELSHR